VPDIWDTILQWVYPENCTECAAPAPERRLPGFCRLCWETIRPIDQPVCPRCGRPFESPIALAHSPGHLCGPCREHTPAFDLALSPYRFEGVLAKALHLYKYRGRVSLATPLADLLSVWLDRLPVVDLVLPVPLHASRLREREFNQSLLLADRLSQRLGVPLSFEHLIRTRATPPQTKMDRDERARNVRKAFAVAKPGEIEGRRLLLLDDVLTTGATVNECAKALRKAGADFVAVVTLARRV
jgi:ComF family protein